jgi:hypothetical protein
MVLPDFAREANSITILAFPATIPSAPATISHKQSRISAHLFS